jgi:regulator of protease activity HflC (stomatin/prohibitin superfamily)
VLIAVSFGAVEPTYQGFVINGNTMQFEFKDGTSDSGELYTEGRYFLGLGKSFITFPRIFQTLDFKKSEGESISIRSKDGLTIDIDVAFQYTLTTNGKELLALYMRWKKDYESAFGKLAKNVVRDVAAKYYAYEFFLNRSTITGDITATMAKDFTVIGASINNFQFLELNLPEDFNREIQVTEVTRTKISEETVKQTKTLIEAQTNLLAAQKQAEVIVTQSKARANALLIQKQQQALTRKSEIEQELIALQYLKTQLNLNTEQLLDYLLIDYLKDSKGKMTFSVEKPQLAFSK